MKNSKILIVFLIFVAFYFIVTYSVFGENIESVDNKLSTDEGNVISGSSSIEELQSMKDDITNRIEEANNHLSVVQDNISDVTIQIEKINVQIAKYQEELNISNIKLAQTQMSVDAITIELEEAQKKYDYQKKILDQRMVAMYEAGDTVYLDVLLSSTGIEDFLSKFYYLSKIAAYDQKLVKEVANAKQDINAKKILLERELAKLTKEKKHNETLLVTFENTKIVRNNYLKELTEQEKEFQEKIKSHEEDVEKIEKEILQATLANISDEYIGGQLAWPVPGHTIVTSGYGMRIHPIFFVYRMHTGVDIGAPKGVPIIAVNDGIVTLATYNGSYGNYVMLDHGGGVVTLYAHGSKILVEEGQEVKKGDAIMLIGSTGWSTGDHLHFEVRIDGETCDPLPYITSNKMPSTNENEEDEDGLEKSETESSKDESSNTINTNENNTNKISTNEENIVQIE